MDKLALYSKYLPYKAKVQYEGKIYDFDSTYGQIGSKVFNERLKKSQIILRTFESITEKEWLDIFKKCVVGIEEKDFWDSENLYKEKLSIEIKKDKHSNKFTHVMLNYKRMRSGNRYNNYQDIFHYGNFGYINRHIMSSSFRSGSDTYLDKLKLIEVFYEYHIDIHDGIKLKQAIEKQL